ncbi:MAG: rhomboid family intramembrane serine protease [Anaerolineae bacterium]|nr:rhomboid family intramembrane serine protease [Anaerolineae bacterium]
MFPLRDTARARSVPLVNWLLMAVNVVVFLLEASLGPRQLAAVTATLGLVPRRLWANPTLPQFTTILTSMFMHGGWWHLISNLWVLFIFGDNVEDRMGHFRYLVFYLLCGVAAALAHAFVSVGSRVPTIGASGAISGVMGAYVVLFPNARILTFVPLWILPTLMEVRALVFIGFWFISQLFNGLFSLAGAVGVRTYGGVAWWAHLGGFVAGLLVVRLLARRVRREYYYGDDWPWW